MLLGISEEKCLTNTQKMTFWLQRALEIIDLQTHTLSDSKANYNQPLKAPVAQ